MDNVYIEKEIKNHPRVLKILARLKPLRTIYCDRYTEIFNRKNQSFRMQKKNPSLILAKKYQNYLHAIPASFGIGGEVNFYFSHLLNCPFDCQYCFLQGLYNSANYVLFVNYEDFQKEVIKNLTANTYFFTGYDADSLALEPKTHFIKEFLPFFQKHTKAYFEIRTKSIFIRPFLEFLPLKNCIIAYTLSPKVITTSLEWKAPTLEKRIEAIQKLQKAGWVIGLRFDPLMFVDQFEEMYESFFSYVFAKISLKNLHSVTIGVFRLPKSYFKNMKKNIGEQKVLALAENRENIISYEKKLSEKMQNFCYRQILKYVEEYKIFLCR